MKRAFSLCVLAILLGGCVGSPAHSTLHYSRVQKTIRTNNDGLLKLRVGMPMADVQAILGSPERSEGYQWGTAYLYRTAMTSGIYGTEDSDFTPVMFDKSGVLIGWGRNFFIEQTKRYEIQMK